MVARTGARAIALLSGSGGAGRTTAAIGLAGYLAGLGQKVLVLDLCFGWGGLGLESRKKFTYDALLNLDDDIGEAVILSEAGFDILTCLPPPVLDPSLDDFKKLVWLSDRLASQYEYLVLDPPAGGHPLSLLAAGLSESVMLFSRPDAASVASSYCLLKSIHAEGIADRVGTVFSFVDSAEQAASLKTRFDMLTGQFLGLKLREYGFVLRLAINSDDTDSMDMGEGIMPDLIKHLDLGNLASLQSETPNEATGSTFPGAAKVRR